MVCHFSQNIEDCNKGSIFSHSFLERLYFYYVFYKLGYGEIAEAKGKDRPLTVQPLNGMDFLYMLVLPSQ